MATTAHKPLEQSSMSALGQKQTSERAYRMSALLPKADIMVHVPLPQLPPACPLAPPMAW